MPRVLTAEQCRDFQRDGFLVLADFVPDEALDALRRRAMELVRAFDPSEAISIFSTDRQTRTSDDYFLTSGDKVRCFFEEEAFDAEGNLRQDEELSINKIGHALHDLDPVFRPFSHDTRLADLAADLGMGTLVLLHGLLPHRSGPNRSSCSRHAYALHAIERDAHYPGDNWLQRRAG